MTEVRSYTRTQVRTITHTVIRTIVIAHGTCCHIKAKHKCEWDSASDQWVVAKQKSYNCITFLYSFIFKFNFSLGSVKDPFKHGRCIWFMAVDPFLLIGAVTAGKDSLFAVVCKHYWVDTGVYRELVHTDFERLYFFRVSYLLCLKIQFYFKYSRIHGDILHESLGVRREFYNT